MGTRRERRVLVAGAAGVVMIVACARGVPAWLAWQRGANARAAELGTRVIQVRRAVASARATQDSLVHRSGRLDALTSRLIAGDTPAAAAATLAALLSDTAEGAAVRVNSLQVRPDSVGRATFTRVAVRVDATGDVDGLTQFLLALETDSTVLVVRELSITQPDPAAPSDRAEALRAEVLVEALAVIQRREGVPPLARGAKP